MVGSVGGFVVAAELLWTLSNQPFGFLLLFGGTALFALVVVGASGIVAGVGSVAGDSLRRWTKSATK